MATMFHLVYLTECKLFCQVLPLLMLCYQRHPLRDDTIINRLIPVMELIHMIYLGLDSNIPLHQMKSFLFGEHHEPSINILNQAMHRIYRTMESHFDAAGWEVVNALRIRTTEHGNQYYAEAWQD